MTTTVLRSLPFRLLNTARIAMPMKWSNTPIASTLGETGLEALLAGTVALTGDIQTIIAWASNLYTQLLIDRVKEEFGREFWGFLMLGGMAGGGMGFIFDPKIKVEARDWLRQCMVETKRTMQTSLPFAMDPRGR